MFVGVEDGWRLALHLDTWRHIWPGLGQVWAGPITAKLAPTSVK